MPVFDFNHMPDEKNDQAVCTYTTFLSSESEASPEQPILILDNRERKWAAHSCGIFTNPVKRTSFEFKEEDGVAAADIRKLDARFVSLLKWLGENHIPGAPFWRKQGGRILCLPDPGDCFWRRNQAVCRGRISAVYD